jgi:phospholipid-binding lipoprotein MlaA
MGLAFAPLVEPHAGVARVRMLRAIGARLLAAALVLGVLAGCATVPPNACRNPADPWERYNRHVSEFNDRFDAVVTRPVARAYVCVTPKPVRDCVSNFFTNAADVPSFLNNVLQAKPTAAATDLCRVAVNTTIGLLGCFDVARNMGLERTDEDFGQTLGYWGVGQGPYFVWPFLGPATVRDSVGRVAGFYTNPIEYIPDVPTRNVLWGVALIDTRANLLSLDRLLDGALDRYQFIRDAYLQRRLNQVFDGNPPRARTDEDDEEEGDPPAAAPAAGEKPDQPSGPPPR